jgi:hypothetical protein
LLLFHLIVVFTKVQLSAPKFLYHFINPGYRN